MTPEKVTVRHSTLQGGMVDRLPDGTELIRPFYARGFVEQWMAQQRAQSDWEEIERVYRQELNTRMQNPGKRP